MFVSACWKEDKDERPSFKVLLEKMVELKRSSAIWLENDSQFHTLQQDWRDEIQMLFNDLKIKENVSSFINIEVVCLSLSFPRFLGAERVGRQDHPREG